MLSENNKEEQKIMTYSKNKGRKNTPNFVMLRHDIIDSEAYRSLSVYARCALVEIIRRYNGSNNGSISYSAREMGERLGCSKNTANNALNQIVNRGFIIITQDSAFNMKQKFARRYALTYERNDLNGHKPTNEWRNWSKA